MINPIDNLSNILKKQKTIALMEAASFFVIAMVKKVQQIASLESQ